MVGLKASQVDGFVRRPDPKMRAILVYGPDRGAVSERSRNIVKTIAGTLDDPFTIARIDETDLGEHAGLLEDEARAIPMMGGPRVVWITGAATHSAAAVGRYLEEPVDNAVVIAEAGPLQTSAKLRQTFERSKIACALPCFADSVRSLGQVIDETVSEFGHRIAPEAKHRLTSLLGADRRLTRTELEKLCTYCHGRETIETMDVDAICGDASALDLDGLVDGTFEGEVDRLDLAFARLIGAGTATQQMIAVLYTHIGKLRSLKLKVDSGDDPKSAVSALRPPVHFSRKDSMIRQVRLWSVEDLNRAAQATAAAEYETRRSDGLAETIVARHFLSLGQAAGRQRSRNW